MKNLFRRIIYLCLLSIFTIAISVAVNLYLSHIRLEQTLQRPILSFVELLSITDYQLLDTREVTFPAFFAMDKRFYMSSEQSELANLHASIGVEYLEEMEGCLNSYVFVSGKLKFESDQHGFVLSKIDKFSKVGLLKEKSKTSNNLNDVLDLINEKISCEI
ncbi:MAG: hypothetical protein AAF431_17575 [Pseudomonadota bacterium]